MVRTFKDQIQNLDVNCKKLAKELGVTDKRLMELLLQNELIQTNSELQKIHWHLNNIDKTEHPDQTIAPDAKTK